MKKFLSHDKNKHAITLIQHFHPRVLMLLFLSARPTIQVSKLLLLLLLYFIISVNTLFVYIFVNILDALAIILKSAD
jgi:hypothetical protein